MGLILQHRTRGGFGPAAAGPGIVLHESEIVARSVVLASVTTAGHCGYVLVMLLPRASIEVRVVIDDHGAFVGAGASLTRSCEREFFLFEKKLTVGHACHCCHAGRAHINSDIPINDARCGQDRKFC